MTAPGEQGLRRETALMLRQVANYVETSAPRWFLGQCAKVVLLAQKLRGVALADAEGSVGAVTSEPSNVVPIGKAIRRREALPGFIREKAHHNRG